MPITRRDLIKAGASAAALASLPRPLVAQLGGAPEPVPPIDDPRLKALTGRALDAARSAGASYADVRLTHTWERRVAYIGDVNDAESITAGVRALVNGYWGFASGPVWSPDEMARLGREAAHQATTNALGKSRVVQLAPAPAVPEGRWVTPVKIDPFTVHPKEIVDFLMSLSLFAARTPRVAVLRNDCHFMQQEKALASSEGCYVTQRTNITQGWFTLELSRDDGQRDGRSLDVLSPAGVGWEMYREQPLRDAITTMIEEIRADLELPIKPLDVGRYDTAVDAISAMQLADRTLGRATELDRALGYEANAGGTSFINDPFAMVGSFQAAGPLVTLNANRSERGGAATVGWDDEGVVPEDFTLVRDGVLADFQTTRESAGWLAEYYARTGRPVRSHGCASAPAAIDVPMQHAPNLVLAPGRESLDFDALVSGIEKGMAIKDLWLEMDFQGLSGMGRGRTYEVKRGKRVARIPIAGFLFRAPELWKGILALGGAASARRYGTAASKGEPAQATYHSVTAVPAAFKQLTFIDPLRKA